MTLYKSKKIEENLFGIEERINKYITNAMYLVIGSTKAALIDTGQGLTGDLDRLVEQMTDLPIIVLNTHAHPDHVGSNALFSEIYMSRRDEPLLDWALSRKTRLGDIPTMIDDESLVDFILSHAVGEDPFPFSDVSHGDEFDLGGGTVLKALSVPGHTDGCIAFQNERDGYCLTGDAIVPFPWLWLEHSSPIDVYRKALERFQEEVPPRTKLYCGHSLEALPEGILADLMTASREISQGKTEDDRLFEIPFRMDTSGMDIRQHDYGEAHIVYNRNRI